jgi:hypothetical protein
MLHKDLLEFKEIDLINLASVKKCFEYSEDEAALSKIIADISVSAILKGKYNYFENDTTERLVLKITIKRDNKTISFDFGMSIADTEFLTFNLGDEIKTNRQIIPDARSVYNHKYSAAYIFTLQFH